MQVDLGPFLILLKGWGLKVDWKGRSAMNTWGGQHHKNAVLRHWHWATQSNIYREAKKKLIKFSLSARPSTPLTPHNKY